VGSTIGALPLPRTTSASEGAGEMIDRQPTEDLPSDEEGLKRSHSSSSTPATSEAREGEKGAASGLRGRGRAAEEGLAGLRAGDLGERGRGGECGIGSKFQNCVAFAALPPMEMTDGSTTSQSCMLLPPL
jgi:hypothetical protein